MKKVFISYPREKAYSAQRLFRELRHFEDVAPWLDEHSLLPGLKWEPAIKKEIRDTNYVVALLSCDSTGREGYQHVELDEALTRLRRFPEDTVFLIPARLDDCEMPRHELDALNRLDFFPDWDRGMERLLSVLLPATSKNQSESKDLRIVSVPRYHYRVGLLDLDLGLSNITSLAESLNQSQSFFLFTYPKMPSVMDAVGNVFGITSLKVFEIPSSFFSERHNLTLDLACCLTRYPLAFLEDDRILYNYFAGESDEDERFLFISTDQLLTFCRQARRTFEEGLVHSIVGQLMNHFTKIGYHHETRGCVMDHCRVRADQVRGLQSRKFCDVCSESLSKGELRTAIEALLSWSY